MYIIRKEFAFSASHRLEDLPSDHPCSRLHGHNYVVVVELRAEELNETGFVRDYRALAPVKEFIDKYLDHQDLNKFFTADALISHQVINPTAENLAKFLFEAFKDDIPELYAIEVSETPKTNARYEQ